ncbi:UvrD-helicase domain-containing protein, partial [Klebsiella pneumoniae]|nr:UvrD-helicase domain-containing protein [Klebsiella pneumoniae]
IAVTFTNKAAGEMKERITELLRASGAAQELPTVGTFHSVCVRILRKDGPKIGLAAGFTIYDGHDSLVAVKQVMDRLQISQKQFNPSYV